MCPSPSFYSFETKSGQKKKKQCTWLQAISWNRSLWWRHAVNAPRPQINTWNAKFSKKVARRSYRGCTRNVHQRIDGFSRLILDAYGSKMSSLVRVTLCGDDSKISLVMAENVRFGSVSMSHRLLQGAALRQCNRSSAVTGAILKGTIWTYLPAVISICTWLSQ